MGRRARGFDISYTLPAQCAASLREGSADIGIIPAAAYCSIPDLAIIPGVAIASRRAVRSILLVSKVPLAEIRTVALDTSSMTSVALTKVLFAKWWGGERTFSAMAPDIEQMLEQHDAGLVIGDPALQIDRSQLRHLRSCGRVDSLHRQAVCFRLLGGAAGSLAGCPQRCRPGGHVSAIARPRVEAGECESHRPRMGASAGIE